jgi:hypothetical protein
MAYYFLIYSNTDSSLAASKVIEFALTLRAFSFLHAVLLLKLKKDHFVKTNGTPTYGPITRTIHEIDNNSFDFYIFTTFLQHESH